MSQKRAQDAVGHQATTSGAIQAPKPKQRSRKKHASQEDDDPSKRRCVSTACVACRYVSISPMHQFTTTNYTVNLASVKVNATAINRVARPAPKFTTPNVSTPHGRITAVKVYTSRTPTVSRRRTARSKHSYKPYSTGQRRMFPVS